MQQAALSALFESVGLPAPSAAQLELTGAEPALPSSFAVGTAAQASIAAAALAAAQVGGMRGAAAAQISVDMQHAALECISYFAVDGLVPNLWDKYSGIYKCADGWVRIHANFQHHRAGALAVLGLTPGEHCGKADVEAALQNWSAEDFETACAQRGLVVAALRTHAQWLAHPQSQAVAQQQLIAIKKIAANPMNALGYAPKSFMNTAWADQKPGTASRPLAGLRVLDLTRILAGPVAGRALAAYGADVLLINGPHLPNIEAIADTSRGKRSAQLDLRTESGRETLAQLVREADVFIQGYRPGALERLGFGAEQLAQLNPRIVAISLSAYGNSGPWAGRRGFDSLVQTATGLNADESAAAGLDLSMAAPKALPVQILDHATGYLMAFAACTLIARQHAEGGAWHATLSLARTAQWLRELGRVEGGLNLKPPPSAELVAPHLYTEASGFGQLTALRHSAKFNGESAQWALPSEKPGTHAAAWW
jgi:crotonobetainyl-CoA:carnitine CoA-transferase CaiB-like acyl-CoA transferase